MSEITFHGATLGNILSSGKNLCVPLNQRTYAWKLDHVNKLYKDLKRAIIKRAPEYFLGSIVIVEKDEGKTIEVHDGQQRLATTMILIAAITDYFHAHGDPKLAERIAGKYLRTADIKSGEPSFNLQLNVEDNEFFCNYVLRQLVDPERRDAKPDPNRESHTRIKAATAAAKKFVSNLTKDLDAAAIVDLINDDWLDFLDNKAKVIWVKVDNEQTAYHIFETMNDRGLKLSSADLIKNYLYSFPGTRSQEIIRKWQGMSAILETLGKEDNDIVDFIRFYWITQHGTTRTPDLFDKVKDSVTSHTAAADFVGKLQVSAQDYAAILTPTHPTWAGYHNEVLANIAVLRFLGVSQIRPLLLAAKAKFSKPEMEKLLRAAVSWSVRILISGVPSANLESNYGRAAKRITEGHISKASEVLTEIVAIVPDNAKFLAAMQNLTVSDHRFARYYLRKLQMTQDNQPEPEYVPNDGEKITLEHILPQTWPLGAGWNHFTEKDHKANFKRLGNLALLQHGPNSNTPNESFAVKKPALQGSGFTLTSRVATLQQWTIETIADRQKELAELAVKAWPLL